MIFGCRSLIIYTNVDIHIDIKGEISIKGHSAMDIRKQLIPMYGYPRFYGCQSSIIHASPSNWIHSIGYPWISMDIYALTCNGFSIQGCEIIPVQLTI